MSHAVEGMNRTKIEMWHITLQATIFIAAAVSAEADPYLLGYHGLGYAGLGYHGLGYAGLGYGGLYGAYAGLY